MKRIVIIAYMSICILSTSCSKVDYKINENYEKAEVTGVELYNAKNSRADQKAMIQSADGKVQVVLKAGEDITHLKIAVTASTGATISPSMSVGYQDFTQSKSYVVTSPNGTIKKTWIIQVQ